ncbi:MAG: hypothetical protein VYE22_37480 [Myxococcota bacterium]|nr:hypothetical protein [Myxococcota bacterium]
MDLIWTRRVLAALLVLCSALFGCDDADDVDDSGVSPPADTGAPDMDTGVADMDTGVPDLDSGLPPADTGVPDMDTGVADTGVPEPVAPVIDRVEWMPMGSCSTGVPSGFRITVSVTDPDTPAGMLTFTGSATGCTGSIDAATSTLTCPNAAPYPSMVTVTDPEGGRDQASFTFGPCETGGVDP